MKFLKPFNIDEFVSLLEQIWRNLALHHFELSFWRHPFTAEDPLVSMW